MLKVSHFRAETEFGASAVPLFGKADAYFEKTASAKLLPEVVQYIAGLQPRNDSQYVLVNAIGAGEWYSSNVNGDYFSESSLIHKPDDWTGNPVLDRIRAGGWAYGFPTFYGAHPYAHHRNKDASRAFGEVELASWNSHMRRVELVTRIDRDKCQRYGGDGTWDKLRSGAYPDVSMGCAPPGSWITMADGLPRPIEEVRTGDWVLSHLGRACRVQSISSRRYEGALYRFKVYGFRRPLELTDEHPLWLVRGEQLECAPSSSTVNRGRRQSHCTPLVKAVSKGCQGCETTPRYNFDWTRADTAEVGDYLAFPVPQAVSRTLQSLDLVRLLGFYLAEGHVGNYNDRPLEQVTFSLGYQEKELADEIETIAKRLGASVTWQSERPERGARTVSVVSKQLARECLLHCGMYSKGKYVSSDVLHLSRDLQLAFLGAYLDGDGGSYKGSLYFSTASEALSQQVFIMLARCGIISSVNEINHRPSEKSVVRRETIEYQIWVGTDFSSILSPYTRRSAYASLKVRGQRFFYEHAGVTYLMAPILEIEEENYSGPVHNFAVEGDDSYVVEGLATHNCKVPFDCCSICLDWEKYHEGLDTFDPARHKHPGMAALEFHKNLISRGGKGIRGLSITRVDYCSHTLKEMNKIYPDGRKVFVTNDFPKFFDISFVFIGADKTAKTMLFIFSSSVPHSVVKPSALVADELGVDDKLGEAKTASVEDEILKQAFGAKLALNKRSEIDKNVIPSQFAGKAVPLLTQYEPDLPPSLIGRLSTLPLEQVLATLGGLGILAKPREFQQLTLAQLGEDKLAAQLDREGAVFEKSAESEAFTLGTQHYLPALAEILTPLTSSRSLLSPAIDQRFLLTKQSSRGVLPPRAPSHSKELLDKIAKAYNGYRQSIMGLISHAPHLAQGSSLHKHASVVDAFSPLSAEYLRYAHADGFGVPEEAENRPQVGVERGTPSKNTWSSTTLLEEFHQ